MTDDGYDSKNKKDLPAYVRMYVRRKVFYKFSVISVIRHLRRLKIKDVWKTGACIWENRCTHLTKQVHVFGSLGAPVFPRSVAPLRRICNPTAPSISICNALINTIWERKHIYALKMLILITVGLQIQPSRRSSGSDQRSSGTLNNRLVGFVIRRHRV